MRLETLQVQSTATTSESFFVGSNEAHIWCFSVADVVPSTQFHTCFFMCIALLEHHCGKHFPGIASALINKALALMQQGNDIDAIASLKKAQRIHESICGERRILCYVFKKHLFNDCDGGQPYYW